MSTGDRELQGTNTIMHGVDSSNRNKAQHKQEYTARASVLGKRKRETVEDGEADFFDPKKNRMYGVQQNAQPEQLGNSTQMFQKSKEPMKWTLAEPRKKTSRSQSCKVSSWSRKGIG